MSRPSRIVQWALMTVMIWSWVSNAHATRPLETDDVQALLEDIQSFEKIVEGGYGSDEVRSKALDSALESRSVLIGLDASQDDPRRPIWLTDQAEALLLQRIEFPSSWSTHLMVAHPSCPLMPAEIPLIVARGLQEILRAEACVARMIAQVEATDGFDDDPKLITLHERLEFEETLRIPLLKAIGLLLASKADPESGIDAFALLESMRTRKDLSDTTREVVEHWFRQAVIRTRNGQALRALTADAGLRSDENALETLREAALLEERSEIIELATKMIRRLDEERSYEKLLIADVVEQMIGSAEARAEHAGATWTMLLDDSEEDENWTLDAPLSARLADLGRSGKGDAASLAILWAIGQQELALRSRDDLGDPKMLETLAQAVRKAPADEPARARALETAIRIALLEEERLLAAELCQILYQEHPRHPFGGPRLVADLTEPWARAGRREACLRHEKALEDLIESLSGRNDESDIGLQTLRLAEHYLRQGRPKRSRELLGGFRPLNPREAARYLDACLQEIVMIRGSEEMTDEGVDLEYDLLRRNVERMLGEFGPLDETLQAAASRARLATISGRTRLPRTSRSKRIVEEIIERENIPGEIRIEALFLRHAMGLKSPSERSSQLESMPWLVRAFELGPTSAGKRLTKTIEERLNSLESLRDIPGQPPDEDGIIDELKTLARLVDPEMVTSLSMQERVLIGRCFNELGLEDRAIAHWDALATEQPDAWVIMQGRADAFALSSDVSDLAEAMRLYMRLGQGRPGEEVPEEAWWSAQLGQLLMLEKADRSTERIPPRIERLKLIDSDLGGARLRIKFESLAKRMTQKS